MENKDRDYKLIILVILLLTNIFSLFNINSMSDKIDNLDYQISALSYEIDDSISNISYSVTEALEKESSLINSFDFKHGSMKDGQVSLRLIANPKEISSEREYAFSYNIDGEEKLVDGKVYNTEVIADISIPIDKALDVSFIVKDGDKKLIGSSNYIAALEEKLVEPFRFEHSGEGLGYSPDKNRVDLHKVGYYLTYSSYDYQEDSSKEFLKDVAVNVAIDENVIDSFPMEKEASDFMGESYSYTYTFDKYSLELKRGETLEVYALANHVDGYKVKIILDSLSLNQNGDPDFNFTGFDEFRSGSSIVY